MRRLAGLLVVLLAAACAPRLRDPGPGQAGHFLRPYDARLRLPA